MGASTLAARQRSALTRFVYLGWFRHVPVIVFQIWARHRVQLVKAVKISPTPEILDAPARHCTWWSTFVECCVANCFVSLCSPPKVLEFSRETVSQCRMYWKQSRRELSSSVFGLCTHKGQTFSTAAFFRGRVNAGGTSTFHVETLSENWQFRLIPAIIFRIWAQHLVQFVKAVKMSPTTNILDTPARHCTSWSTFVKCC